MKHNGVACKSCPMNPIVGVRYKCMVCDDLDLCEKCYTGQKPKPCIPHHFMAITTGKFIFISIALQNTDSFKRLIEIHVSQLLK